MFTIFIPLYVSKETVEYIMMVNKKTEFAELHDLIFLILSLDVMKKGAIAPALYNC